MTGAASVPGLSVKAQARLDTLIGEAAGTRRAALPDLPAGRAVSVPLEAALQLPEVPAHLRRALWRAHVTAPGADSALDVMGALRGGQVLLGEPEAGFALMALADPGRVLTAAAAQAELDAAWTLPAPVSADARLGPALTAQLERLALGKPGPLRTVRARLTSRETKAWQVTTAALPALEPERLAAHLSAGLRALLRELLNEPRAVIVLDGWGAAALDVRVQHRELKVARGPGGLRGVIGEADAALLLAPPRPRVPLTGWTRGSVPAAIQATGVHVPDTWNVLMTASHLLTWPPGYAKALQVRLPVTPQVPRGVRPTPSFGTVSRVPAPDVDCPAWPRERGDTAAAVHATRARRPAQAVGARGAR